MVPRVLFARPFHSINTLETEEGAPLGGTEVKVGASAQEKTIHDLVNIIEIAG